MRRKTSRVTLAAGIVLSVLTGLAAFVLSNRYGPPQERRPAASEDPVASIADDLSWAAYGADPGMTRHSRIAQITPENVGRLRMAWTYRTGEVERRGRWGKWGKFQATPIVAAGHLVFCTPFGRVVALDPASGRERWIHEPAVALGPRLPGERFGCRGLARWRANDEANGKPCAERLFLATTDRRLLALDAQEGTPCPEFGNGGEVRVPLERDGLGEDELQVTSAPAVVGDVVVEHGRLAWEVPLGNTRELAPFGMAFRFGTPGFGGPVVTAGGLVFIAATVDNLLRAFDARTGEELWARRTSVWRPGHADDLCDRRPAIRRRGGGHPSIGNEVGDALVAFALR